MINYFECQNGPELQKLQCYGLSPSSSYEFDQSSFYDQVINNWSSRAIGDDNDETYSSADFLQLIVALCDVFADASRKFIALTVSLVTATVIVYRMIRRTFSMVFAIGNRDNRLSMAAFYVKCMVTAVSVYALVIVYEPVVTCQLNSIMKLMNTLRSLLVGADKCPYKSYNTIQ